MVAQANRVADAASDQGAVTRELGAAVDDWDRLSVHDLPNDRSSPTKKLPSPICLVEA